MNLERRAVLGGVAASALALLLGVPRRAGATLVRGLTLAELLSGSDRIAIVTPLFAESRWENVRGQRGIVTDTRVRVEDTIRGRSRVTEVMVRSLGGRVGSVGELVHGQPDLQVGQVGVVFLKETSGNLHVTTGMAQGHYPLVRRSDGAQLLTASRSLPAIFRWQGSAVQALRDKELDDARRIIARFSR